MDWLFATAAIQSAIAELLKRLLPLNLVPAAHQERAKIVVAGISAAIVAVGQWGAGTAPGPWWETWLLAWLAGSGLYTFVRGAGVRDIAPNLAVRP